MGRVITASVVVALLASSAFGQIGNIGPQQQGYHVGLGGTAVLTGGTGDAHNAQSFGTLLIQGASSGEGTQAYQGMGLLICQNADVANAGAPIGIEQDAEVNGDVFTAPSGLVVLGGQSQSFAAYAGPATQYEGIAVSGGQHIEKLEGGTGNASGENTVLMGMAQLGGNQCQTMGQGMLIGGDQESSLNGNTCASAGEVTTNFGIMVTQTQTANCALAICPPPATE